MKKRVTATLLAAVMIVCGVMTVPTKSKATAATIPETVAYEQRNIGEYWSAGEKTAPVKEGYFFGGWFQKGAGDTYTALTEAELTATGNLNTLTNVYAKFVPSYVLSVKAQIETATQNSNGNTSETYLRVITGLDSTQYQGIKFDLWYNNRIQQTSDKITKVYAAMTNSEGTIQPETAIGEAAHYFCALKLAKIQSNNYTKTIFVRPCWTTLDGTEVWGNGKYVRVEDGYTSNRYISVPVNLQEGSAIAAGALELSYNADDLEVVDVTIGRVLTEMASNTTTAGVIKFVGNAPLNSGDTPTNVEADGLYANVRFQKKAGVAATSWDFAITGESFCNWNEEMVSNVKAWDVRY